MIADLIERHGFPTDKCSVHSYGGFYDRELARFRDRPIRLLEVGVDRGGSLRLWDAYFDHRAEIVGVDIDLSRIEPGARRIAALIRADAYTEAMAIGLGQYDIIIDDGPHTLASMLKLIRLYTPRLNPGGLMVIEDVQDWSWYSRLMDAVPDGYAWEAHDLRSVKHRYDDMLFVIRKPA